ncbi:hypothetical protein F4561_000790 [Lipingzhangella halophila]|uniref:DUF4386 family protein n=1 Tax=Lipingzhangella halophila TaxID=1783352 RepID=A0A7W7W1S5_9ACTN|nr:hypothetical protein [Lipingzhangella halophila]MBB4929970.1 hypothetical protein [Lipingzhangella halophila]
MQQTSSHHRTPDSAAGRAEPGGAAHRVHGLVSAALMAAGVALFMWGGSQHPPTDTSMGVVGSEDYFRTFAEHVARTEDWRSTHAGLLAGPLLWALGSVGFAAHARARPATGAGFAQSGLVALAMGAVAWSVVFVVDGFVAPLQAESAAAGDFTPEAMAAFRFSQEIVGRLGLVSWLLIGAGIAGLAAAVLADRDLGPVWRLGLGLSGVAIGLWPAAGAAVGIFQPSVFTSALWVPTALVTSLWFLLAAVALLWRGARPPRAASVSAP